MTLTLTLTLAMAMALAVGEVVSKVVVTQRATENHGEPQS